MTTSSDPTVSVDIGMLDEHRTAALASHLEHVRRLAEPVGYSLVPTADARRLDEAEHLLRLCLGEIRRYRRGLERIALMAGPPGPDNPPPRLQRITAAAAELLSDAEVGVE